MVDKREFSKVLVANRGEIAVRIMRSAQELGLKVVAIYEETDKDAFHIMRADEAVCIGPGPRQDYLNIGKIMRPPKKPGPRPFTRATAFWRKTPISPKPAPMPAWYLSGRPRRSSGTWAARSSPAKSPRTPASR